MNNTDYSITAAWRVTAWCLHSRTEGTRTSHQGQQQHTPGAHPPPGRQAGTARSCPGQRVGARWPPSPCRPPPGPCCPRHPGPNLFTACRLRGVEGHSWPAVAAPRPASSSPAECHQDRSSFHLIKGDTRTRRRGGAAMCRHPPRRACRETHGVCWPARRHASAHSGPPAPAGHARATSLAAGAGSSRT